MGNRIVAFGVIALLSACGSNGGSGVAFCHDWASAFCHKIYQCPSPDGPNPLAGSSEAECTAGWEKTCTDPPPSGVTFDINCSGGKTVNEAAKTTCLSQITSATCDAFNGPTYTNDCDKVCVVGSSTGAAGTTGAGGSTGSGGTTGAGGSGSGSLPTPQSFCVASNTALCSVTFRCVPAADRDADFVTDFGNNAGECVSKMTPQCSTAATDCPDYSSALAEACIPKLNALTCTDFDALNLPAECFFACP